MKHLKLSFALFIAVITISTTAATKASFGRKDVTVCFTQFTLRDQNGTLSTAFIADAHESPRQSCNLVKAQLVIATPLNYIHAANVTTAIPGDLYCLGTASFCCAFVTPLLPSDPGFAATPALNLGDGVARKYKIATISDIFCHNI